MNQPFIIELREVPKGTDTIYQAINPFTGEVVADRKTARKYVAALVGMFDPNKTNAQEYLAGKNSSLVSCWGRPELFIKGGYNNPQFYSQPQGEFRNGQWVKTGEENLVPIFAVVPDLARTLKTWKHC